MAPASAAISNRDAYDTVRHPIPFFALSLRIHQLVTRQSDIPDASTPEPDGNLLSHNEVWKRVCSMEVVFQSSPLDACPVFSPLSSSLIRLANQPDTI